MKLLLADDERELSRAIEVILRHNGYDVECAYDGEQAIEMAHNGDFDAYILDIMMPGKMQLHERFKFDEEGRPMLYVFENCRDFRRTIPALVYDARRPEDIDTAGEDHIYDETRYFLMSRPIAPRKRSAGPRGLGGDFDFSPLNPLGTP